MLERVSNNTNPNYQYIGTNEIGYKEYLVNIKESKGNKKTINLDDALMDCDEFPDDYFVNDWQETRTKETDENNLTENDFYRMDFKTIQYHIYRQLVNISSLLSDIQEVLKDDTKIG